MEKSENKILFIITLFSIGGATETVVSLASGLQKKGYVVEIVTGPPLNNEGNMFYKAKQENLQVTVMKELVRDIDPFRDLISLFKIFWFIKKGRYSIVHTHSSKAGVIGRVAAWFAKVPVIVHTIHGLPYHNYQSLSLSKSYILIEQICARITTKIISVSYSIVNSCLKNKIANKYKFAVIRSGLEISNYHDSEKFKDQIRHYYGLNKNDIVAGVISRIAPLKGHEYIIELAKKTKDKYPKLKYLMVGDGEFSSIMKKDVQANNLGNVIIFTGMVNPEEIPQMICAMDFVIHTSLHEGLARVLPQSIIMDKKVITFDLDGVEEVVDDNKSGYIVKLGDSDGLFLACCKMCDYGLHNNIEDDFKLKIKNEFCSATMVEKHDLLFKELISS